jgi:hypothetical protein
MKLKFIYTVFTLCLCAFLWMSNSAGRAAGGNGNATVSGCGAAGACHKGGTFQSKGTLLISAAGADVTEYVPGATYDVEFRIEKTGGTGTPMAYGFQLRAITATEDAGTFANFTPAADIQIATLNGRKFVEHNKKSSASSFKMKWTAPAKGTGEVNFLAAGNAVNSNSNNGGDAPTAGVALTLKEKTSIAALELPTWATAITVTPNPVQAEAFLNIKASEMADAQIRIYDLQGKIYQHNSVNITYGENYIPLNVNDLAKGIYVVSILSNGNYSYRKFVK